MSDFQQMQQVIFDDGQNQFSDIQEPSDDHPSELMVEGLLQEDDGHDSSERRQDDHNSIDDKKYFLDDNHLQIKDPQFTQPKRQRS